MNELKKEYLNYLEKTTGKRDGCVVSFFRKANDFEIENNIEIEKFKEEEDIKNFLKFFSRTSPNSLSVCFSRLKKYYQYLYTHKGITSLVKYTNMKYADYKDFVSAEIYNSRIITREELYAQIGKPFNTKRSSSLVFASYPLFLLNLYPLGIHDIDGVVLRLATSSKEGFVVSYSPNEAW